MKRQAQPALSVGGQQALDQYASALNLETKSIRNYLSDLRQFMVWCECSWHDEQDKPPFTPQRIVPPILIRYRTYLQTTLWLKPSTINRALMSLKRYFAWATSMHVIEHDPNISRIELGQRRKPRKEIRLMNSARYSVVHSQPSLSQKAAVKASP